MNGAEKGMPAWLDGEFRWEYPGDSVPAMVKEFKSGHPVLAKYYHAIRFHDTLFNGMTEVVDYTRKYNNIRGTYYYEEQRNTRIFIGKPVYGQRWFRKGKKKWRLHRL